MMMTTIVHQRVDMLFNIKPIPLLGNIIEC